MPLKLPDLTATPAFLADWVEFRTVCDEHSFFRLNALKRYWDTQREREESDPVGEEAVEKNTDEDGVSGPDEDLFIDAVIEELARRMAVLGEAYPFDFSDDNLRIRVKPDQTYGSYCYLFCLFLSHNTAGDLLTGAWLPEIDNNVRDLFQACSTVAAAGHVNGCAVSLGSPLPANAVALLERLRDIYKVFGEGTVVGAVPRGASPYAKDAQIDIIAWTPRRDGPGTIYMLGQVASGHNWREKSVLGGIGSFHSTWFAPHPQSDPLAAMFIPHLLASIAAGTREEAMNFLIAEFGMIFDRLSVPHLALKGIGLTMGVNPPALIERVTDLEEIMHWVIGEVTYLRLSGEAPL